MGVLGFFEKMAEFSKNLNNWCFKLKKAGQRVILGAETEYGIGF